LASDRVESAWAVLCRAAAMLEVCRALTRGRAFEMYQIAIEAFTETDARK
jgi:hypothetical protein